MCGHISAVMSKLRQGSEKEKGFEAAIATRAARGRAPHWSLEVRWSKYLCYCWKRHPRGVEIWIDKTYCPPCGRRYHHRIHLQNEIISLYNLNDLMFRNPSSTFPGGLVLGRKEITQICTRTDFPAIKMWSFSWKRIYFCKADFL